MSLVAGTKSEQNSSVLLLSVKFQKVAEEVARLHDAFYTNKTLQEMAKVSTLQQLGPKYYSDSDLVDTLPKDMEFNT